MMLTHSTRVLSATVFFSAVLVLSACSTKVRTVGDPAAERAAEARAAAAEKARADAQAATTAAEARAVAAEMAEENAQAAATAAQATATKEQARADGLAGDLRRLEGTLNILRESLATAQEALGAATNAGQREAARDAVSKVQRDLDAV